MLYVKTDGGLGVLVYPYRATDFRTELAGVSARALNDWPADRLAEEFSVFPVTNVGRPDPSDPLTVDVVEAPPQRINGVWTQQWTETAASPDEIERRTRENEIQSEVATAKQDAWVSAFLAMTPAEAQQNVLDTVTDLASAKTMMSRMAFALRVLARRGLHL